MLSKNIFLILSLLSIPFGFILIVMGYDKMSDSEYYIQDISHGFLLSLGWTILGGSIFYQWLLWFSAHMLSFVPTYRLEQFIFNCGLLFISAIFLIGGLIFMSANPLYLNLCECKEGFYGPECLPCPQMNGQICNGHGTCDDLLLGTGQCDCNVGYEGISCNLCSVRFKKDVDEETCICEKVWTGEACDIAAPGFNTTYYPYVFCVRGWLQTGFENTPKNRFWTLPTIWPICGACEPFYAGHPEVSCTKCLGHNGSIPLSEENTCNGHGLCWDNDNYDKKVFRCTGEDCMPGIPEGGLINQCTPSWNICEKDTDCPGTFNCAGRCLSIYSFPKGPTESWAGEFDGKVCRSNEECNFQGNPYIGSILPEGWDTEGECAQYSCCAEAARGNFSCYNCRDNDIYDPNGNYVSKGPISWGRMAPACDDCPGWDNDLDVNGQTICNAKGTCNPLVDALDNYVGMGCACTTDIETGQKWTGDFCQCLKTAPPSSTLLNIVNTPLTNIWIDGTVNYTNPGLDVEWQPLYDHYIDISKWPDNTIYNDMKYQLDNANDYSLDMKLYECDFPFDDGMYHLTKFENNKYYLENKTVRYEDFIGVKDACDFRPCNYDDVCIADETNIMKAHCEMNLTRRFVEFEELKIRQDEFYLKMTDTVPDVILNLFRFVEEKVWNQDIMDYEDVTFGYITFDSNTLNVLLENDTHVNTHDDDDHKIEAILRLMNMTIINDMYNCLGNNPMRDVNISGPISAIENQQWYELFEFHILDARLVTYPYTCTIYTKDLDYFRRNCTGMVMNLMFNATLQDSIAIGDEIIIETPGTLDAMNRNQFIVLNKLEKVYTMVLIVDYHDTFTEDFCLPPPTDTSLLDEKCNVGENKVHDVDKIRTVAAAKEACEKTISGYANPDLNGNCIYSEPFQVDFSSFPQTYICDNCARPGKIVKKEIPGSETCQRCVQGFFLEAFNPGDDHEFWITGDWEVQEIPGKCFPCPGVPEVSGTGLAACNFRRGLGSCIYADAVKKRKDELVYNPTTGEMERESKQAYRDRLNNIGKCSCTTRLDDEPRIAAYGDSCEEAPPNFYRYEVGKDWTILSCPRTLALGLSVCESEFPEYIWDHVGADGTPRRSCTQSCGGKPLLMSVCSDDSFFNLNISMLIEKTSGADWDFINQSMLNNNLDYTTLDGFNINNLSDIINNTVISNVSEIEMKHFYNTNDIEDKGKCFCNGNNLAAEPTLYEYHYYRSFTGLCVKSKVKTILN